MYLTDFFNQFMFRHLLFCSYYRSAMSTNMEPLGLITSHPLGVQSIVISVSVCMSVYFVCLSVCLSTRISKNHTSKSRQIFYTRYCYCESVLL